jgi:hypothetical protein
MRVLRWIPVFLALSTALPAFAGTGPIVGQSLHNDLSPPLRDMPPILPDSSRGLRMMPEPRRPKPGALPPLVVDAVLQNSFTGGLRAPRAMPTPILDFDGMGNLDSTVPPDTNGDVGPNHYVQMINSSIQVFNKSGASVFGPVSISTLWQGFSEGNCSTRNDGDPIVLYDPMADRWLVSQFTTANPFGECIAISQTPDPTGAYHRYFFQFSTTVLFDYPHFGVWPDGYYMAAERFEGDTYLGSAALVFDRAKMLAGQSATFQQFDVSPEGGANVLQPADLDGSTLPPAGSPNYYVNRGGPGGNLQTFAFHVDWASSASSSFTGPTAMAVAAYNQLCPGTQNCVPQPETSVALDGLGDRILHRMAYRNFGSYASMVFNHAVDAGSGKAGIRWYEIRITSGTPALFQQGTYAPDATSRWLGSIAMDQSGNIALGYSVSSGSVFPGIRYTGQLAGDASGVMTQGEASLVEGGGSQLSNDPQNPGGRWGDYAMMAVDPSDDCTFWFTTEYIPTTSDAGWKTRIGSFRFPSCGSGPGGTPTPTLPPPTATPTPTGPPAPPQDLGIQALSGSFNLSWQPGPGPAPTGYEVFRADNGAGLFSSVAQTDSSTLLYMHSGILPGTFFDYKIQAMGDGGPSGLSKRLQGIRDSVAPAGSKQHSFTNEAQDDLEITLWDFGHARTAPGLLPGRAATEKLVDGGFEDQSGAPWGKLGGTASAFCDATCNNLALASHGGSHNAALADAGPSDDWLWQEVAVPADASSATLDFWFAVDATAADPNSSPTNGLSALICDAGTATPSAPCGNPVYATAMDQEEFKANQPWTRRTLALDPNQVAAVAGKTVRILFHATTTATDGTIFLLDDASFQVDTAGPTVTPTPAPGGCQLQLDVKNPDNSPAGSVHAGGGASSRLLLASAPAGVFGYTVSLPDGCPGPEGYAVTTRPAPRPTPASSLLFTMALLALAALGFLRKRRRLGRSRESER